MFRVVYYIRNSKNMNKETKLYKLPNIPFSFTLRHKTVFKWILSKPDVFTCFVCIWSFGRVWSSKYTLPVSFRARRAGTHTSPGEQCLSCGLYFQHFIIKHVQQLTVKTAFYNNRQTIDLMFWSGRNECVTLVKEGSCARRKRGYILRSQNKIKNH